MNNVRPVCLLCFFLGAALMLFISNLVPPGDVQINARENSAAAAHPARFCDVAHPLGRMEAIPFPLAHPNGIFPDEEDRLRQPEWIFQHFSESDLQRFLEGCALDAEEQRLVLDRRNWQISSNGCVIRPSEQLVWKLNAAGRQQIYNLLARDAGNYSQRFPFRFPLDGFETKFKESGLASVRLEKLKTLTYTNGGTLCFADMAAARGYLDSGEFNRFAETLCSVPAYLLRLHLDPECNLDEVIRYWGRGGREKLIAPLLSSMARVPGGA